MEVGHSSLLPLQVKNESAMAGRWGGRGGRKIALSLSPLSPLDRLESADYSYRQDDGRLADHVG